MHLSKFLCNSQSAYSNVVIVGDLNVNMVTEPHCLTDTLHIMAIHVGTL